MKPLPAASVSARPSVGELNFELAQHTVAWQDLSHTGTRFPPLSNGGHELSVLQLRLSCWSWREAASPATAARLRPLSGRHPDDRAAPGPRLSPV